MLQTSAIWQFTPLGILLISILTNHNKIITTAAYLVIWTHVLWVPQVTGSVAAHYEKTKFISCLFLLSATDRKRLKKQVKKNHVDQNVAAVG